MPFKNTATRFGLLTKLLHWTGAALVLGLIWLGWYMVDLTYFDRWYNASRDWHKSLGVLALALVLAKIGWQLYSPLPDTMSRLQTWERFCARTIHWVLLAMMVVIPVSGFLISTSAGKPVQIFDWLQIPALIPVTAELRELAIELHYYAAYSSLVLVIGHAGAAIKHQLVDRDDTLIRMLWK